MTWAWLGRFSVRIEWSGGRLYIDPYLLKEKERPADLVLISNSSCRPLVPGGLRDRSQAGDAPDRTRRRRGRLRAEMLQCINHQPQYEENLQVDRSEFAPGFVSLILIPDLNNKNAVNPLEPRVSLNLLERVRQYLCRRISPFAARHLKVLNPLYEKVQVEFGVEFRTGFDRGYYEKELQQDIIQFLSPWAFEQGEDITFGGRLHKSVILNFVEERPYVDYLTEFKMNHYTTAPQPRANIEEAVPVSARSIIVSHSEHFIKSAKNGS